MALTYFGPVTPLAQAIIVVCVVALTVALIFTLVSVRRTVSRTDAILAIVEREIRPMATQVEALAEEVRGLTRQVTREIERVSVVVRRLEDISAAVVRVGSLASTLTNVGRMAGVAVAVKRGVDAFVSRLKG